MAASVAYILKGYPRLSELFIASEIYRLEQAGFPLKLFVLKLADEAFQHAVVERIRVQPHYLPATSSVSGTTALRWLVDNVGQFLPALARVARRAPLRLVWAGGAAFAQAVRARKTFWSWPRRVYLKEFFQAVALADAVLEAGDVRHLHAHFAHGTTTVTWLAALLTGLPFSFTAHAKDIYDGSLNPAGLLKRKLDAARFAVTCTEANRAYIQTLGSATPVHRIYHGLNADFAALIQHSNSTCEDVQPPDPLRILGVGRLVHKKGFDVFVEACARLRTRGIPVEAVIVGEEGDHSAEVRRKIAALELCDCVQLAGPMDQAGLYDMYRRATVFCLPCRVLDSGDRDGIPNVLVEAMACGLPIVTTGISGIPEAITDMVSGILVPPDDPAAVAAAIERLHHDPALARRLGCAAIQTVRERFDGDLLAAQLIELFRQSVADLGAGADAQRVQP